MRSDLLREARALARLSDHPRIVTIFDAGEYRTVPYLVMRLMTGGDLAAELNKQPGRRLSPERAGAVGSDVLSALEAAHDAGVTHRDIKPTNIWLDGEGNGVLGDFGVAAGGAAGHSSSLANPVGTILYMPPELIGGQPVGPSSDLYSFGCTLYEMLTGKPPFAGDPGAVVAQHLAGEPVPPSKLVAHIPPALDRLVLGLLSKNPGDRPASAAKAREALIASIARPAAPVAPHRIGPDVQQGLPAPSPGWQRTAAPMAPAAPITQQPTKQQPSAPAPFSRRPTKPSPTGLASAHDGRNWKRTVRRWVLGVSAVAAVLAVGMAAIVLTRQGTGVVRIRDLRVMNNVYEQIENDFEAGSSIVACFTVETDVSDEWLDVVVTSDTKPPSRQEYAGVIGVSDPVKTGTAPPCVPVRFGAYRLSAGTYYVWVLHWNTILGRTSFRTNGRSVHAAVATPSPLPTQFPESPTPGPSPAPTASPTLAQRTPTSAGSPVTSNPFEFCRLAVTFDPNYDERPTTLFYTGPEQYPSQGYWWRCSEGKVLACETGGTGGLCMRLVTSRTPNERMIEFCRDNRNSDWIFYYALGHAPRPYEWACRGGRAVIVGTHSSYDPKDFDSLGYYIANWLEVRPR